MKTDKLITIIISGLIVLGLIIPITVNIARNSYSVSVDYHQIKDLTIVEALPLTKTIWSLHSLVLEEYAQDHKDSLSLAEIWKIHNDVVAKLLKQTTGRTSIESVAEKYNYKYIMQKDALFQMVLCTLYQMEPGKLLTMKVKDLYLLHEEFMRDQRNA